MSGRVRLSNKRIAALRPRNRRYDVWDSEAPGLIVQVTTTGHLSYMLCRRMPGARNPTRRKIAEVGAVELDEARAVAREWTAAIRRGTDPGTERTKGGAEPKPVLTFAMVVEDYIKRRVSQLRRSQHTAREVRQLADRWGKLALADVTRAEVVKFMEELGARSPSMAHRQFGHLRAMFNWLRERGTIEVSPCDRIRPSKLVGPVKPRQRTLNDAEVRAFWIATDKLPYPHGPLHRLVLLTATRLREVADAEWKEFDLEARVWNIPPERTKTRAAHIIPLSDQAVELLTSLPRKRGRYVFCAVGQNKPVKNFHSPKAKIDAEMQKVLRRKPDPWVVHDLRRVVRSWLAQSGVSSEVAERVLGHGSGDTLVRTYNTYEYLPEVRAALEKWGNNLNLLDCQ